MLSNLNLILIFALTIIISIWVSGLVRQAALGASFVDIPGEVLRKRHGRRVPLLGGTAIFLSFFSVIFFLYFKGAIPPGYVHFRQLTALFLGGLILILGGALDDKYNLKPRFQIIFPILAALFAVLGGIHFTFIKNPFGGMINLAISDFRFQISDFVISLIFPADILSFLWLLGMIYTTKLLDGLDGLSVGVAAIASIMIALVSLRIELNQPQTALLSGILTAVFIGFLFWNFYPARIFLGEGGSTLVGFLVGSLAIVAGSKLATTLLVLGVPLLDMAAVILKRVRAGKRITEGGREHLHFRLLDAGVSERLAVLIYYLFAFLFGAISWFLKTAGKLAAFIILVFIFLMLLGIIERRTKKYEV